MRQMIAALALLALAGAAHAQNDKAAAKAAAAEMKARQKQARADVAAAQKVYDDIMLKIKDKTAGEAEVLSECKKGQALVQKAIKSGAVEEKKLGEAYKLSGDLALQPHNIELNHASNKQPFDTAYFYSNLRTLTDAIHNELKSTPVVKGDAGNEGYLKSKCLSLARCGDYYIYAAQFEGACNRYKSALEAYATAMGYAKVYPETAEMVKLRVPNEQIAYYAYHTAHEGKMYDEMDKYYDEAVKFAEGALGTKQVRMASYLERGDSARWATYVRDLTLSDPAGNKDYVQILLAYYMKKGHAEMTAYADEVLAKDPNLLIANYGKAYVLFAEEKYEEALVFYKKCAEIDPKYYDAWYQCGLCKFRQALALNATVSGIKNQVKAKAALEKTKSLFASAIPFFEKARECAPDEPMKWAYELKQCYSVTGQAAKAAAMDKLM